jgi:hypothetical protein
MALEAVRGENDENDETEEIARVQTQKPVPWMAAQRE